MERLLTIEERNKFTREAEKQANNLQQSAEGHFTLEDIEGIYQDADSAMLEAQRDLTQRETLKAVGEWISNHPFNTPEAKEFIEFVEALKCGEFPG